MEVSNAGRLHLILDGVSDTGRGTVYNYDSEEKGSSSNFNGSNVSQTMLAIPEVVKVFISEPVVKNRFPFLFSACFATIFEDVLVQIRILDNYNSSLKIEKTVLDIDDLRAIKYNVRIRNEKDDELNRINLQNLNNMIYKIKKLDNDRTFLNNVVTATYLSLTQNQSFEPLSKCINSILELDAYRLQIAEEHNKNKILRKELSKQVRQQRNHIKTVLYDTDASIDKLRTQVEDSDLFTEVRSRYIDNWQRARMSQHNQIIYETENKPASAIEFYKRKSEHEIRIHMEVDCLVSININEILHRIEEWMEKYDKDMEAIDLNIQIKKNEYQNMRDKRVHLEETLEKHKLQMQLWKDFKEERERIRAYREKMTKSAIILQAWWRGLLVRLELGPFRPRKSKNANKKQKKEK